MSKKVNPIDVEQFLEKTNFPAQKNDIITFAKNDHAPEPILAALQNIPDRQYSNPQDAAKETFSAEDEPQGPMGIDSCED
ncbi:DUF2795 domain-containing protein [Chitinispirillales bacterium ANBcel5]|uniref:DUF2795 domain-containing protein n=1 Tax=Cellulosispirillum alkaliphilum TaxID=3039283 RepID=UPI002A52A10E|nr:DUF2795 domain-containing protein [Chitinispirillales bacterium ANBcel5]